MQDPARRPRSAEAPGEPRAPVAGTGTPRLASIQALRGIAAAMIVVLHAHHEAGLAKPFFPLRVGVDLFFAISGFIMVYTSQRLFTRRGGWRSFMSRRLIRIVPVYWLYTSALVLVALALPSGLQRATLEPGHLLLSYLFVPHHDPQGAVRPFLELGWTLNYEMYFYAMFAALLFLPPRRMLAALTAIFGISVVAGHWIAEGHAALHFWTRPIVMAFVGGAWVGHAFVAGRRLPAPVAGLLLALAAALLLGPQPPAALRPWTLQAAAVLLVALAVLPRTLAGRSVPRVLVALGDASYTVYLSHPFILAAAALVPAPVPAGLRCALSILAALALGVVLYATIEKPLLSLTRRVFSGHSRRLGAGLGDGIVRGSGLAAP